MVTNKQAKRKRDIKTKLMAAICMLLVSSIMMVSTTYAWFTLSTAPEVTGINTAVGANGNLEMALMPLDGLTNGAAADFGIGSAVGDSNRDWNEKNTTWGNLVDLSDSDTYGLNKITLYPAKLNINEAAADDGSDTINTTSMLGTPQYGADGRMFTDFGTTLTSTYGKAEGGEATTNFPQNSFYGVRAVGAASGMTTRQLDYRNFTSAANTSKSQAITAARNSLTTNGQALANIAVKLVADSNTIFTDADVTSLKAIVDDLNKSDGVLDKIDDSYANFLLAYAASAATGTDDTIYNAVVGSCESQNASYILSFLLGDQCLNTTIENLGENHPLTQVSGWITKLNATRTAVANAGTKLDQLSGNSYTWTENLSDPVNLLLQKDKLNINGNSVGDIKNDLGSVVNDVMAQGGLIVTMPSGAGVYADIADHCGDYSASITIYNVSAGGVTLKETPARMDTKGYNPHYLSTLGTAVTDAKAPTSSTGEVLPLTDMYGYVVDLAFRTNAASSNLLLQTTPVNRIYEKDTVGATEETSGISTMGKGSTMTFTSTTPDFTADQLQKLMGAIRVVFFDPTANGKILGYAKLDMTEANLKIEGGNRITANLYLYESRAAATERVVVEEAVFNAVKAGTGEITKLYTKNTVDEGAEQTWTEYTKDNMQDVDWAAGTYYADITTEAGDHFLTENDAVLKALTQNQATAVSALVYLDGANVTNEDVAATDATSMTGTMNLQFSSSATLVPMQYTALQNQTGSASEAETFTVTMTEGAFDGASSATKGTAYNFKVNEGYTLGVVTVGGVAVTPTDNGDGSYTIPADQVTGTIVISVPTGTEGT